MAASPRRLQTLICSRGRDVTLIADLPSDGAATFSACWTYFFAIRLQLEREQNCNLAAFFSFIASYCNEVELEEEVGGGGRGGGGELVPWAI